MCLPPIEGIEIGRGGIQPKEPLSVSCSNWLKEKCSNWLKEAQT